MFERMVCITILTSYLLFILIYSMIQFPLVNVSIPSWDPKEHFRRYILSSYYLNAITEETLNQFYIGHTFVDGRGDLFIIKGFSRENPILRLFMKPSKRKRIRLKIEPTGQSMQFAEMQQHMYHQAICMSQGDGEVIDLSHIYNARSIHDLLGS